MDGRREGLTHGQMIGRMNRNKTGRWVEGQNDIWMHKQLDIQTDEKQTDRQAVRQMERQTDRFTVRQMDRTTDRWIESRQMERQGDRW